MKLYGKGDGLEYRHSDRAGDTGRGYGGYWMYGSNTGNGHVNVWETWDGAGLPIDVGFEEEVEPYLYPNYLIRK